MKKTILLSLCLLLVGAGLASAAVRRVPGQYAAIQMAISDCNDGDVVIVEPGIYFETINFIGKDIVVTSLDPNDPEIVAETIIDADADGTVVTFENGESPAAVLTGFTIMGGYGTLNNVLSPEVRIFWGAGIYCYQASPTITRNVIAGNHGPAQIGDIIEDIEVSYGGAIACIESSPVITRNIIRSNRAYVGAGIIVYFGDAKITSNLICDNSAYLGGGVVMVEGRLTNNTIVGNDANLLGTLASGMGGNVYAAFDPAFRACEVSNNIICNAGSGGGLFWEGVYDEWSVRFNNVWNNAPGNYGVYDSTGQPIYDASLDKTGVLGNISEDPLFVSAETRDYHLQTDSLCINAGDPLLVPEPDEMDIDGDPRLFGGRVDMGVDEYVGYVKPIADAGPDQHVDKPQLITLDGSGSYFYDPCGVTMFQWTQIAGPLVTLSDPNVMHPTFMPESEGDYRFELVVSDATNDSQPDEVLIIVRNRPPVADAGPDQSMSFIPATVALDGSGSYDPGGDPLTYHWRQIAGPAVDLSDENAVEPNFAPSEIGVYVFELIVNDGLIDSSPDNVGIVIGNRAPIADAGSPRYAAEDPVVLDGTGSFDRDGYGELTYQWQQISGPSVDIADANSGTPTISGFIQTGAIQRCEFELIVSDGDLVSEPDTVDVIIVPYFGDKQIVQMNPPFDPAKPTIVAFGGGDCNIGGGMPLASPSDWHANANVLTVSSYGPAYYRYGDPLIVYLSSVAPYYAQPIQTMGYSTGTMPAIDVAIYVNETYADARFAVNRVSLLDAACRDYASDIAKFLASSVDAEPCWIDNYHATLGRYYAGTLNIRFPAPATHDTPYTWYTRSPDPGFWPGGDLYSDGITAGYYISVAGPAKNLRLAPDPNNYRFEWNSATDYLELDDEFQYPGRILEPVTLIGPEDGAVVDANGAIFSCEVSERAVGYQLLFGADPYHLNYLVSDTPGPPEQLITVFPFKTTYWTIMARDEYGSTIYADPVRIECERVEAQAVENLTTGRRYGSIQRAINDAASGDEIVVSPGIYQYFENIDFQGKILTVRSTDPNDPAVVATTVINGRGLDAVATFSGGEDVNCVLAGFTITGADKGIYCCGASPTITKCAIVGNTGAGIKLWNESNLTITNCAITANGADGIEMRAERSGRFIKYNYATVHNCLIAGNQKNGILGSIPTVANCTIVGNRQRGISSMGTMISNSIICYNGHGYDLVQIETYSSTVTYCNIQGGWSGIGNIDAAPCFVDPGYWADADDPNVLAEQGDPNAVWVGSDYHLPPDSPCIDAGDPNYTLQSGETDLDGNSRLTGQAIDMGAFESQTMIELSEDEFEFEAVIGFSGPAKQLLIVRNGGVGTLNWQITCDCDWLKVGRNTGSSTGQGNAVVLEVDATGLAAGNYNCAMTISAPFAVNSPQVVPVKLAVHKNCFPDAPEYAQQYADFLAYLALGSDPSCWCAPPHGSGYQCDGDADGDTQTPLEYRVFTNDLLCVIENWKKKITDPTIDPCCDFDHKAETYLQYRVFGNDLAIVVAGWKKESSELPGDCPRPNGQ